GPRCGWPEPAVRVLRAEPHAALDAGAVVPASGEQDHLARARKLRDVALEIPLRLLALRRSRKGDDPTHAGIQALGDGLDDAALTRGITSFEDDHHPQPLLADPFLELDQLELESGELKEIGLVAEP